MSPILLVAIAAVVLFVTILALVSRFKRCPSDKILVISTADIAANDQLFIPYGADYWCQDKFPIPILAAAIRCYDINIHSSPQWSQLSAYPQLSCF
jgi:hypothetical protein